MKSSMWRSCFCAYSRMIHAYAGRQQTVSEHQQRIGEYLRLRAFDAAAGERLARFLEDEALRLERTASLLARAHAWLRDEQRSRADAGEGQDEGGEPDTRPGDDGADDRTSTARVQRDAAWRRAGEREGALTGCRGGRPGAGAV